MKKFLKLMVAEESGQGMVEYGLIILLVALVVIGAIEVLGASTFNMYIKTEVAIH